MSEQEKVRNRSIYILPNLFTTGSLLAAFFAIISAFKGNFVLASICIFISTILDALDGRVARMTNTESDFGADYDSLADVVAFGVAPSLILYFWELKTFKHFGWVIAFIYLACVALRLARFNNQPEDNSAESKRYFTGLACTPAAAAIAGFVWFANTTQLFINHASLLGIITIVITVFIAAMMVSNLKFRSFKDYDLKGGVKFHHFVLAVIILSVIFIAPEKTLFIVFMGYSLSGLFSWIFTKKSS